MVTEIPLARRDVIEARLAEGQPVVAATLALEFGVSEDAIRRDLRALAALGRCRRVYGGALPVSPATLPMAARMEEARERKHALARAAAAAIRPRELIFLDSGSTNLALTECLPEDCELTVATNSIDVAAAVLRRPDLQLFMVGGAVNATVGGCVDAEAVLAVARMNIDRCFIGACAVSATSGICAFDSADATFKRALLAASRQKLVLATNDKFEASASYRVSTVGAIDCLVVEHDFDARARARLAKAGVSILQAERPA
jgi:DeoR/GlpR family transcriptional regulator of sugar metabolism